MNITNIKNTKDIKDTDDVKDNDGNIDYLNYRSSEFEMTDGGFLKLTINGKEYPYVELYKTFPFSFPDNFIFVKDRAGNEIGCIKDINQFSQETIELFKKELKRRYFIPKILRIVRLREKLGEYIWDVETDSGRIEFNTTRRRGNLFMIGEQRILVKDKFENRYEIPNLEEIKNNKFRRMIEAAIY
jgi:hypothetical protein